MPRTIGRAMRRPGATSNASCTPLTPGEGPSLLPLGFIMYKLLGTCSCLPWPSRSTEKMAIRRARILGPARHAIPDVSMTGRH